MTDLARVAVLKGDRVSAAFQILNSHMGRMSAARPGTNPLTPAGQVMITWWLLQPPPK